MDLETVFICRKCNHHLFAEYIDLKSIEVVLNHDCPRCGEDAYQNWILSHIGNSDDEKDNYKWVDE